MQGQRPWLNTEILRLLTWHSSGQLGALFLFWLVHLVMKYVIEDPRVLQVLLLMDEVALVGMFLFFIIEVFRVLIETVRHGTCCFIIA